MKSLKAYFKGWSSAIRYKRMTLILYLFNFILALLSAFPVSGFLGQSVGRSMSLERSVPGFDYTFWSEMKQVFGDQINAILDQAIWFVILYLIISIFLMGGILTIFKNNPERFSLKLFWQGASKYFWRLVRLTVYFLSSHVVLLVLFLSIFSAMTNGLNPFKLESEEQLLNAFFVVAPIYLLCFTTLTLVQDYAKIELVHRDPKWLTSTFWGSFKKVFQNFRSFFSLYLLNMLTLGLVFLVYWQISDRIIPDTMSSIALLFLIGQIFIILRILIKLLNLAGITHLYQWTRGHV